MDAGMLDTAQVTLEMDCCVMCGGEYITSYSVPRPAPLVADSSSTLALFAKELDVQEHGIPVTVANTTYMGTNVLHLSVLVSLAWQNLHLRFS